MSKREHLASTAPAIEIKFADNGEPDGTFTGYASTWTTDRTRDRIEKGAFLKSLAARPAGRVRMLWNHNPDEPIGVFTSLEEDERGLKATGRILTETRRGAEALALMRANAIDGLSIGFISKSADYDKAQKVRVLKEVDLWEVSLVAFAANQDATITNIKTDSAPGLVRALHAASAAFQKEVR